MSDVILVEAWAIRAEDGGYLIMEQTADTSIDVMTTNYIDNAHYFNTYEEAQDEAKKILNNDGKFEYWKVSNPVGVVKVEKTIKVGTVKGLK
ncbi:ribonuclease e [Bacillus phage vB_BanS_Nate]|uniref:Ribonuclease e n=1 Tax=Bacillus phage vB_BanS_Nate TaxID=2894788 RepID=A0AAE9CEC1_9CAUD|nr:ribonuclease e [Bacillus phage vB_BanS_Nate]UGO50941.1 ribonuclease e [Bacillus phage vB_BanS_Nate]